MFNHQHPLLLKGSMTKKKKNMQNRHEIGLFLLGIGALLEKKSGTETKWVFPKMVVPNNHGFSY